ncbi:MAG: YtxH domain-containing protein [Bacteroidaceae bacterium]|nr:YtxH domain-containing protein [Bacteroidaceae bacterium]MBQ4055999.1 YtxH domain-containing protein [Bacteroidaceae bacterium]MBR6620933.1 YtxH domain-containing protein [Bacteroides sp.]
MNNGKLIIGLLLGAVAGSALTCFAHSHRGKKLRRNLYERMQCLRENCPCKDCTNEESCDCQEYPQPDEVIEVVAGEVKSKADESKGQ